jgi:hypothetical protein
VSKVPISDIFSHINIDNFADSSAVDNIFNSTVEIGISQNVANDNLKALISCRPFNFKTFIQIAWNGFFKQDMIAKSDCLHCVPIMVDIVCTNIQNVGKPARHKKRLVRNVPRTLWQFRQISKLLRPLLNNITNGNNRRLSCSQRLLKISLPSCPRTQHRYCYHFYLLFTTHKHR